MSESGRAAGDWAVKQRKYLQSQAIHMAFKPGSSEVYRSWV